MTTIAKQLKEEGRKYGIQEGKIEIAKRLLTEGSILNNTKDLIKWVQKMTGLSLKQIKEL